MSGYVQVIERIPKPGKNEIVLDRSVAILKSLCRRGTVMASVSDATDRRVVGLLPFESISDLETFHDEYRANPGAMKQFEENGADCDKVRMEILELLELPYAQLEDLNIGVGPYWSLNEESFTTSL